MGGILCSTEATGPTEIRSLEFLALAPCSWEREEGSNQQLILLDETFVNVPKLQVPGVGAGEQTMLPGRRVRPTSQKVQLVGLESSGPHPRTLLYLFTYQYPLS